MLETLLKHLKEQKDLGLTNDILMETFKSAIKPLKYSDKEVYDEVVDKLYKECYGEHFSDWLAEKAVENFKNVDGTEGAHWSVEQIDDVVGDVDGMIVTAPAERSRGALLVEVVPCPDVEVRIIILGRGGCLAQGHLVASQGGESTVFREILVFVGEQGSVFLARLGYHFSGWGDVEEIIATGESYHRQHHDDAHQISSFHCLHSFRNLRLRQI